MKKGIIHILLFFIFYNVTLSVTAQSDPSKEREAKIHFEAGKSYYNHGRFEDALKEFKTAYELSPNPLLLYNIGLCYRELGKWKEAIDAFERYLKEYPEAPDREIVLKRIEQMKKFIEEEREEKIKEHEAIKEPEKKKEKIEVGEVKREEKVEREVKERKEEERGVVEERGAKNRSMMILGWGLSGVGLSAILGSIITGVLALNLKDELDSCSNDGIYNGCDKMTAKEFLDKKDRLSTLSLTTDILIGVGSAFAIAGGSLLLLYYLTGKENKGSAKVEFIPSLNGVFVNVRF